MKSQSFSLQIITPCFCAGAEPEKQAEIRAASIRGQLRWWFRTLGGFASLVARLPVRAQEDAIFGATSGGTGNAGKLIVRVTHPRSASIIVDDDKMDAPVGSDRGYLLFPLRPEKKGKPDEKKRNRAVLNPKADSKSADSRFDLHLLWRGDSSLWADVEALVAVFSNLGALGFRSRRAMGAVQLAKPAASLRAALTRFADPAAIEVFSASVAGTSDPANEAIGELARWLKKWREHGRTTTHRPPPDDPKNPGFDFALRDHDEGAVATGAARPTAPKSGHEPAGSPGETFRAAIGLPIEQYFGSSGRKCQWHPQFNARSGKGEGRFASPILLRPHFDGSQWRALIIFLNNRQWDCSAPVHLVSRGSNTTRTVLPDLFNAMKADAAATMAAFP